MFYQACRFPGAQCKHRMHLCATDFFLHEAATRSASRKVLTCSSGFTLRKIAEIRPSPSMTNVLRSAPMYFFPYMLFSTQTPYALTIFLSGSDKRGNGNRYFSINF